MYNTIKKISFSALLLISVWVHGQDYHTIKISKDNAVEDFEYFQKALEEGFPWLYWHTDSIRLQKVFNFTKKQLNLEENISYQEFHGLLIEIMQLVGCGHSGIFIPKYYRDYIDSVDLYLPFNIKLTEDKIFIKEDLFNIGIPLGSEIIAINGINSKEIIQFLQPKIPTDKGIVTKQIRHLELLFPYYFAIFYGIQTDYEIKYINSNNSTMQVKKLKAVSRDSKILKSGKQFSLGKIPLEFKIENDQTAYLKINTFSPYSFKKAEINFSDTLSEIFTLLDSLNTNNLILDLRGNIGGSMKYGEILFSFFINSPINYFRTAKIKKTVADGNYKYAQVPRLKERLESMYNLTKSGEFYILSSSDSVFPNPNHFKGQLYILSNGLSFSSTACFIAECKDKEKAIIIGEVPGGAYSGLNTQPHIAVVLPNSLLELHFQATHINLNVNKPETQVPIDYEIIPSIDNILGDIDVEKEFVLNLILKK